MIDKEARDRFTAEILDQIHDMQTEGYDVGRGHELLPKVRSFSELHDYFDANVAWGDEFEKACFDENGECGESETDFVNAVFNAVDRQLRIEAGEASYVFADGGGLRTEGPRGHAILSHTSEGGYFDLMLHGYGIRAAAEQVLAEHGYARVGEWEIVTDDGLRYVGPHQALRAIVE